jgi:CrcB protein
MERFVWICLGGAVGTGARYLVSGWALRWLGSGFPWGTLAVNVLGSFLIGAVMHLGVTVDWMSPTLRLALTAGVLGGFTTYSAFSYETLRLLQEDAWLLALGNVGLTVTACFGACLLGFVAARAIVGG